MTFGVLQDKNVEAVCEKKKSHSSEGVSSARALYQPDVKRHVCDTGLS